jgi:hypothetical protein
MAIYSSTGNLNAGEEIIWPQKKFHRLRQKMVHIGTFIGQFSTVFGIFSQFCDCQRAFGLSQITGMKGGGSQ